MLAGVGRAHFGIMHSVMHHSVMMHASHPPVQGLHACGSVRSLFPSMTVHTVETKVIHVGTSAKCSSLCHTPPQLTCMWTACAHADVTPSPEPAAAVPADTAPSTSESPAKEDQPEVVFYEGDGGSNTELALSILLAGTVLYAPLTMASIGRCELCRVVACRCSQHRG